MRFSLPSIKCSEGPPSLRLLPNPDRCLNCSQRFDYSALGSSRKLGGAGEHLIDGSEKRICRLSFEFQSPHVIERRSNITVRRLRRTCCLCNYICKWLDVQVFSDQECKPPAPSPASSMLWLGGDLKEPTRLS